MTIQGCAIGSTVLTLYAAWLQFEQALDIACGNKSRHKSLWLDDLFKMAAIWGTCHTSRHQVLKCNDCFQTWVGTQRGTMTRIA